MLRATFHLILFAPVNIALSPSSWFGSLSYIWFDCHEKIVKTCIAFKEKDVWFSYGGIELQGRRMQGNKSCFHAWIIPVLLSPSFSSFSSFYLHKESWSNIYKKPGKLYSIVWNFVWQVELLLVAVIKKSFWVPEEFVWAHSHTPASSDDQIWSLSGYIYNG